MSASICVSLFSLSGVGSYLRDQEMNTELQPYGGWYQASNAKLTESLQPQISGELVPDSSLSHSVTPIFCALHTTITRVNSYAYMYSCRVIK